MAKVPIAEVKQAWRDDLANLSAYSTVNVHAAWPGEGLLFMSGLPASANWKAAIWFGPSKPFSVERHSMRADRQRRIYRIIIPVLIEVQVEGESNDQQQTETIAALQAEQIAWDLWQPIDEHVADEKHLSSPGLVESAVVDFEAADAGYTDTGFGFRLMMPVIATFRIL